MKKQLLSLMLMLVGTMVWAQSGWTDPSSEYQAQTVVYLAIDCDEYDIFYYSDGYVNYNYTPEIAAFIDGELRVAGNLSDYEVDMNPEDKTRIYALRVGGIAEDEGKEITFKIYDERSGIIYPLTYEGEAISYMGDVTFNSPSNYYTMTFTSATSIKLFEKETEVTQLSICVGQQKSLDSYYAKVYDAQGNEIEVEAPGFWDIEYGPNRPYVQKIEAEDGSVWIKGMQETPEDEATGENLYMECVFYVVGSLYVPVSVQVLPEYFPVTSIAIDDVNYYWRGYGRLSIKDDMVTYNNGEIYPTNPGVKIVSSSNPDIVAIVGESGLNYKGIGSSVITVAAIDDESVTTTFTVNVLSGLNGIRIEGDNPYHCMRYGADEEYLKLPMVSFDWIMGDDGAPVIGDTYESENYTMTSSNTDVLRIDDMEVISLKRGTATVTYTSNYDPTKTAELTVIVGQSIEEVKITKVGATEVITSPTHETIVDIAVGQEVTAVACISPVDADYNSFILEIVDRDGIPFDEKMVEIGETVVQDGTCEFTFTFTSVPDRDVILKAVVDGQWEDRVLLNVINSVVSITPVPEEITLWLTEDEIGQYTGTINVTVLPEDATNKELEVMTSDENIVSVELKEDGEGYIYTIHERGTATLTFTSVDNPSASAECVITVKKKVESIELEMEEWDLFNDGMSHNASIYIYPADADYDVDKLTAHVENEAHGDIELGDWQFVTVEEYGAFDGGKRYGIAGRAICDYARVIFSYDATEQGDEMPIETWWEGRVIEKIRFDYGWNWISVISAGVSLYDIEPSLDEARSQTELAIVDPEWGLFGYLSWLDPYEAYKVKIKDEAEVLEYIPLEGGWMNSDGSVDDKVIEHGWNWESYPYEYNYPLTDIFDPAQFAEGDIILSKDDGMATIVDGAWEGNLDMLRYHQGYLIYSNTQGEYSVTMPNRYYDLEQGTHEEDNPRAQRRDRSVWLFDGSRFANTMAVIGQFDLNNPEDYTIGAFVGDECRGEGKFVNGRAYITAAGKAGEMVTLRLYNTWTGEFVEVEGAVAFSDIAGSVKEPVCFKAGETTSIEHVEAGALTIQGNVALATGAIQIFDVQGKIVAEGFQRVDLSHLNSGVYVVKAGEASRKVIK